MRASRARPTTAAGIRDIFILKITIKGQVTIPQRVREKLGLHPHSEVDFVTGGDRSQRMLERYGATHSLWINDVIYSEVSIGFERIEDLEAALN